MYLHLGDEFVIPYQNIIGIFDLDGVTVTKTGRTFLQDAEKRGAIVSLTENLPKSFIVATENGRETVYFSQISAATLHQRILRGVASDFEME